VRESFPAPTIAGIPSREQSVRVFFFFFFFFFFFLANN
jgi:hypothetical protein